MIKPLPHGEVRRLVITPEMRNKYLEFGKGRRVKKRRLSKEEKERRQPSFLKSEEWKRLRYMAIVKYGRTCMACGRKAPDVIIHVDHIKPRSQYPRLALDIDNLQILCATCNVGKGSEFTDDFRPGEEAQDFLTDAAREG